jgi:transcriptional regulator with GAF, ATPase, and Fis domain
LLFFNKASEVAESTGDHNALRTVVLNISDSLFWKGKISEAIERYEKVLGNLEEFGDDEFALKSNSMLGWCYVICGRVSRGLGKIDAIRSRANSFHLHDAFLFASVIKALSLMEVRRVAEAESCLKDIFSLPPGIDDPYLLSASYRCFAYACSSLQQYEEAFEWHRKLSGYISFLGLKYHTGSHVFEYLYELEKRGFFLPEMNYDSEIGRIINGDDFYMKGIALRYKAIKNIKVRELKGRAFLDLRKSEKHLKMIGAEIELARTWITLGDAYLKKGEVKVALSYLEKPGHLFSTIDKNLFPKDLLVIMMPQEQKAEFMIDRIISINESLAAVRDLPVFLERVINLAMDFSMAMRGAFFEIDRENKPRIIASRNLDPMLLKAEQFKIIEEVIEFVAQSDTEAIMPGLNHHSNISDEVLTMAGIHSIICMPAKLDDHTYGYLYLDNRVGSEAFPDSHLPYVRLLCNQIAIGLSNISIYNEIREMKERFEEEATFYKREMGIASPLETIIGKSESMKTVLDQIRQVAPTDSSVLIMGETGVGKELVAKAIHNLSSRKTGPFIPVNLAALAHELVASELFEHEKGAFTGANERYKGRFELAHGGTIFLDEIGDLPSNISIKLLRVLQEGTFERLGSAKPIQSDFRVIAATNKDLLREIENSAFRQDLYYRLNVFPILFPPLQDRKEDIPLIAGHFIEKFSRRMGKKLRSIANDELRKLAAYHWPGNVRELEHFIERAIILSSGGQIKFPSIEQPFEGQSLDESQGKPRPLAEMERSYIEGILNSTHWRVSGPNGAASILGLKPTTLLSRMKKLGIRKMYR